AACSTSPTATAPTSWNRAISPSSCPCTATGGWSGAGTTPCATTRPWKHSAAWSGRAAAWRSGCWPGATSASPASSAPASTWRSNSTASAASAATRSGYWMMLFLTTPADPVGARPGAGGRPRMKHRISLALAALLALSAALSPALAQDTQPVDSIVAVVDEDVILRSELDMAVANIVAQYADQAGTLPPRDVLERQVLDRLVLMRLQAARARDSGIRVSDSEGTQAVQTVAARNRMTMDQLRERLQADGLGYDQFRATLREEMLIERLRQRYLQSRVQVSEAEVDQLLETREIGGPEVHLGIILVALPDGASPEQVATAQQKAAGIKAVIDSGELDFRSAAIRYSDAPNALDGGDLGWRGYDAIPPAFAGLVRSLQPGEVSEPIRAPGGFQLIHVAEVREAGRQVVTEYNAPHLLVRVPAT